MRIKSIVDVITNSSSEVYVIRDSSKENINQTLSKLGISGIGKIIKFNLSRYRKWLEGKLKKITWDEEHYFQYLYAFLDEDDPESIKHYIWRYIVYEENKWVPSKNGSACCIPGELDRHQKDYKKSGLEFEDWYEKKKSENDLPGIKDILSRSIYQITLQEMDGLYMTGSVEENSVSPEDIDKIISNLNAIRYFI